MQGFTIRTVSSDDGTVVATIFRPLNVNYEYIPPNNPSKQSSPRLPRPLNRDSLASARSRSSPPASPGLIKNRSDRSRSVHIMMSWYSFLLIVSSTATQL